MLSVTLLSQIWRFVLRRTAARPGGGTHGHPEGVPPTGTNVQHHGGELDCVFCHLRPIKAVFITSICFQGYYSGLALRDIGPFLRYMESEFNVKVVGRRKTCL